MFARIVVDRVERRRSGVAAEAAAAEAAAPHGPTVYRQKVFGAKSVFVCDDGVIPAQHFLQMERFSR